MSHDLVVAGILSVARAPIAAPDRALAAPGRQRRSNAMNSLTSGLRNRARQFGCAMLRLTGLDDASMDLEEARLREELYRIEAERGSAPAPQGYRAKIADALQARAIKGAWNALGDAERWRP